MKKCPTCGAENLDDSRFCTNCGTPLSEVKVEEEVKPVEEPTIAETPVVEEFKPVEEPMPVVEETKQAEPEIEIPVPTKPKDEEIHLTLEGALDAELAKADVDSELARLEQQRKQREAEIAKRLEEKEKGEPEKKEEEDLSDILGAAATGVITSGNVQAQTQIERPVDLVIPEPKDSQTAAAEAAEEFYRKENERQRRRTEELLKKQEEEKLARENDFARRKKEAAEAARKKVYGAATEGDFKYAENDKDELFACVSYFTWIGLIISFLATKDKKRSDFLKGHMNTALILNVLALLTDIRLFGPIISVLVCVLWFYNIFCAFRGKQKDIPYIGEFKIFK